MRGDYCLVRVLEPELERAALRGARDDLSDFAPIDPDERSMGLRARAYAPIVGACGCVVWNERERRAENMMKILRCIALAAVVGCTLLTSDASATRTPEQSVGLSAVFRLQLQGIADESDDASVDSAIEHALEVMNTEQKNLSATLKKAANELKALDKALGDHVTYNEQAEFLIGLYSITMGTCGQQGLVAILQGKGSIIAKAKRSGAFARALEKAGDYAADTTKPRHKRIKKLAALVKKAEGLTKNQ
jgi:hypothetical protein